MFQVFGINRYRESLSTYWQVDSHENIGSISEIILGETKAYVFFERHYGDLHSYVRQKKRLREEEARSLVRQIVAAVQHCHDNGVILRDLKLRKFVFKNKERLVSVKFLHFQRPLTLLYCKYSKIQITEVLLQIMQIEFSKQ